MPSNIQAELLIDRIENPSEYRAVVSGWVDAVIAATRPDAREAEGTVIVQREPGLGGRSRRMTPKNLEWAYDEAALGRSIICGIPGAGGQRLTVHIEVIRYEEEPWVQLAFEVPEERLENDLDGSFQRRVLDTVRSIADLTDPIFGWVGYGGDRTYTELELALGTHGIVSTYSTSRHYLRGYDWVTVIPKEIIARLGGVGRLAESGAFVSLIELRSGAVEAVASDRFLGYGQAEVRHVFEAVAPALRPGVPKPRPVWKGEQPKRSPFVMEDAAAWGAT